MICIQLWEVRELDKFAGGGRIETGGITEPFGRAFALERLSCVTLAVVCQLPSDLGGAGKCVYVILSSRFQALIHIKEPSDQGMLWEISKRFGDESQVR
jgi:hypothetical protein